jgi:hypothetical protein
MTDKKKKLAKYKMSNNKKGGSSMIKPIGSVVLSPDQQEKTMTMGKQPIKVYP